MKKILIADDKATSRELIRVALDGCRYTITEASDGKQALERAREVAPDLIILDLHMPVVDGFGVVAELRRDDDFASIPVMALTASAMRGDRQRAIAAGFDSYVTKPIPLPSLRAEIERLLGSGDNNGEDR